jgi:cytochrome c55X
MGEPLRLILIAVFVALALVAAPAARAEPSSPAEARKAELMHRLRHDCGSCHGMTLKGGLGPPLLPVAIADKPDPVLAEVILKGLPGTPMPPWDFEITRAEALWLVRQLKEGVDGKR